MYIHKPSYVFKKFKSSLWGNFIEYDFYCILLLLWDLVKRYNNGDIYKTFMRHLQSRREYHKLRDNREENLPCSYIPV